MKRRVMIALFIASLFITVFNVTWKIPHVHAPAGGNVWIVPSVSSPTLATAVAQAGPNDEIHVGSPSYVEVLGADLIITQANLWIIGSYNHDPGAPIIDLSGFTIVIAAPNVFVCGLRILDSGGTSLNGIVLTAPSLSCTIMYNFITGSYPSNPSSTGILVLTNGNTITRNIMNYWSGCINLASPSSFSNTVKANLLGSTYPGTSLYGVSVSLGAGFNYVYWNSIASPTELYDNNPPGSPPNWFDDTTGGGPSRNKGNFEVSWASPLPYPVPPGTNGYVDNWPLVAGINLPAGDLNLDGQVSLGDLVILAQNYGKVWCQLGWDPRADIATPYGAIGLSDLVVLAQNYGKKL